MQKTAAIKIIGALLCFAAAGFFVIRSLNGSETTHEGLPEKTVWLCRNPDCGGSFEMSASKLKPQLVEGKLPPCPKCGQRTTVRGHVCPFCKEPYLPVGHGSRAKVCPNCGKDIPP